MSFKVNPKVTVNTKYVDGKMMETKTRDGKVEQMSVFEDINNDGSITEDEITKVVKYHYNEDGSYKQITDFDSDRDGYSDIQSTVEYNKDGDVIKLTREKLKDIKTEVGSWLYNRSMQVIRSGMFQM